MYRIYVVCSTVYVLITITVNQCIRNMQAISLADQSDKIFFEKGFQASSTTHDSPSVVPEPRASAPPANSLEVWALGPRRPDESGSRVRRTISVLTNPTSQILMHTQVCVPKTRGKKKQLCRIKFWGRCRTENPTQGGEKNVKFLKILFTLFFLKWMMKDIIKSLIASAGYV